MNEEAIFSDQNASVTRSLARIGGTSYPIISISSIKVVMQDGHNITRVALILAAVFCFWVATQVVDWFAALCFFAMFAGLLYACFLVKARYSLILTTNGRDISASNPVIRTMSSAFAKPLSVRSLCGRRRMKRAQTTFRQQKAQHAAKQAGL